MQKKIFLILISLSLFSLGFGQNEIAQTISNALPASSPSPTDPNLLVKMGVLAGISLLPFIVMLLTSFLKMVVVLSLLRNALGVQQTPPNQVLNGVALILTIYVMFPTGMAMYNNVKEIPSKPPTEVFSGQSALYLIEVVDKAKEPFKQFLQKNCIPKHIKSFYNLTQKMFPDPYKAQIKGTDFLVLIPAYITSQLKGAYEIGVLIYLPFFVVDIVTSNILLAMGMMMLSPLTISLPIKLLLLVMLDGWTLLVQGLVLTFK